MAGLFDCLYVIRLVFFVFFAPTWAMVVTGLPVVWSVVGAVELGLVGLSALLPVRPPSTAGGGPPRRRRAVLTTEVEQLAAPRPRAAGRRLLRVALTVMAIATLNFVLNLIWPFRF